MSKMTESVKTTRENKDKEINFMGGISYKMNPLTTLKMVTASSIFGEPAYYRNGEFSDGKYAVDECFQPYNVFSKAFEGKKTSTIMEEVIDASLEYDFKATIDWAVELRKDYFMRLNPQVIMVRAACHKDRVTFSEQYPGYFKSCNRRVMSRADEPATQLTYYLYKNRTKNNLPSILKRSWAERIENMSAYEMHKYSNSEVGLIDTVRVCHANSVLVNELMTNGSIKVEDSNSTWETLRSQGKTWREVLATITIPHMALLRNLRGIFTEIDDRDFCQEVLSLLKNGVLKGKQFPFRYYTAKRMIDSSYGVNHKTLILDALEECIDIAKANMPTLKGKTMCLSDNSGSAWGTFDSEYGSVTVAEIDNLSSVITAQNSEEGYVGKFGDELKVFSAPKREGCLSLANKISKIRGVGEGTENGVWLFFKNAIDKKEHWDNIFIYSDQQAGHGGLYGTIEDAKEYSSRGYRIRPCGYSPYIDVAKLVADYRRLVNPKVNVFSVQTAGYTNSTIPEYGYRTNILYGWTGKELVFADKMIKLWNEYDEMKGRDAK